MKYYRVLFSQRYSAPRNRKIPTEIVGTLAKMRDDVPRYLRMMRLPNAKIEEWELIVQATEVLRRIGTIDEARRIVWRKP